nr:hypothetical protein [Pandoravirus massiliensis]
MPSLFVCLHKPGKKRCRRRHFGGAGRPFVAPSRPLLAPQGLREQNKATLSEGKRRLVYLHPISLFFASFVWRVPKKSNLSSAGDESLRFRCLPMRGDTQGKAAAGIAGPFYLWKM